MYTFPFCRLKNDRITAILSSRLIVLCRFAAKIGCAFHLTKLECASRINLTRYKSYLKGCFIVFALR